MTLSSKIILKSVVSFLIIATFSLVFYLQKTDVDNSSEQVSITYDMLKQSTKLEKLVIDMETGFRGYLITGKHAYLEPYNNAKKKYAELIDNIDRAANDEERELLQSIRSKIELWLEYATGIIALKKESSTSKKAKSVFTKESDEKFQSAHGKKIIDDIRRDFDSFNKIEEEVQKTRLKELNSSLEITNYLIVALGAFFMVFSSIATTLIVRSIRKRISDMVGYSEKIAAGDFELVIKDGHKDELTSLSTSLNRMASDLKIAFEERKKAEDKALLNERKFRQLVEDASDIIYRCDNEGNFVYVNPMAEKLTGYTESELLKMNYKDLLVPEHKEEVVHFYLKQFHTKTPNTHKEFQVQTKHHEKVWVGQTVQILFNGYTIEGFLAIVRDITERKKIEEELITARKVAEESVTAKEVFLANMSHEIRTPMNAIIGFTDLLLKSKIDEEQINFIKAIKTSGENLLVLVNDILDFSKIEANKISFEKTEFNIRELIANCQKTLSLKARDKDIELRMSIEDQVPEIVVGDPYRLNQIFLNLITNAIKFTDKGFVETRASVLGKDASEAYFLFQVIDTGIGIPIHKQNEIFESFTQASTDTTRIYGGTGLGLSIVKNLVELQNGKIYVSSQEGLGSKFSFELKYKLTYSNETPETKKHKNLAVLSSDMRSLRILLVDDNHLNQMLGKKILSQYNMDTTVAEHGKVALDLLEHSTFDLVLMDIRMPEMDGYTATECIRKNFEEPVRSIPIIAMTANAISGEVDKCKAVGMNDYISKPFKEEDLIYKIRLWTHHEPSSNTEDDMPMLPHEHTGETLTKYCDLAYLRKIGNNKPEFVQNMIRIFIKQRDEFASKLEIGLQSQDWDSVGNIAHKIKPSVTLMGIHALEEPLEKLEQFSFDRMRLNEIHALVEVIKEILDKSVLELGEELQRMQ